MKIPNEQPTPKTPPLLLNPVLADLPAYPLARLDERRRKLEGKGEKLFDFGTGDPREPTDPAIRVDQCGPAGADLDQVRAVPETLVAERPDVHTMRLAARGLSYRFEAAAAF